MKKYIKTYQATFKVLSRYGISHYYNRYRYFIGKININQAKKRAKTYANIQGWKLVKIKLIRKRKIYKPKIDFGLNR